MKIAKTSPHMGGAFLEHVKCLHPDVQPPKRKEKGVIVQVDEDGNVVKNRYSDATVKAFLIHNAQVVERRAIKDAALARGETLPPCRVKNPPPFREGDWHCARCGNHNLAFRTQCNRCKEDKGGSGTTGHVVVPGGHSQS